MSDLAALASAIKMGLSLNEALDCSWSGLNALARGFNELGARQAEAQPRSAEEAKLAAGLKAGEELAKRIIKTGAKKLDTALTKGL